MDPLNVPIEDFELIHNDATAPTKAEAAKLVTPEKSSSHEVSIVKDQVFILKSQNNVKMKQMERHMEEKLSIITEKFNTQKLKLQLKQDEMDSKQKVNTKKVMDILNDQKQQLYGINAFVEDCFNDLQKKYVVERSIYDTKMNQLNSEICGLKTRMSKMEALMNSIEITTAKQPMKNISTEYEVNIEHLKSLSLNEKDAICMDPTRSFIMTENDCGSSNRSLNLIDLDCRTICVKTVHDQSFQISISNNSTISEVKVFIHEILGIPIEQQILVGNGKVCNDEAQVEEDVLYLIISK